MMMKYGTASKNTYDQQSSRSACACHAHSPTEPACDVRFIKYICKNDMQERSHERTKKQTDKYKKGLVNILPCNFTSKEADPL